MSLTILTLHITRHAQSYIEILDFQVGLYFQFELFTIVWNYKKEIERLVIFNYRIV